MSGSPQRPCFPGDHVCESLRDYPVPTLEQAKRSLANRAAHLESRIGLRARLGQRVVMELAELAAIVTLVEQLEDAAATTRIAADGIYQIVGDVAVISLRDLGWLAFNAGERADSKYGRALDAANRPFPDWVIAEAFRRLGYSPLNKPQSEEEP